MADVSRWLAGHGVTAETLGAAALPDDAEQLESIAHDLGANFIVAVAYGHSRRREWAFGGVAGWIGGRINGAIRSAAMVGAAT